MHVYGALLAFYLLEYDDGTNVHDTSLMTDS